MNPSSSSGLANGGDEGGAVRARLCVYSHNNGNRPAAYVRIGSSDTGLNGSAALALNTWSHLAMT